MVLRRCMGSLAGGGLGIGLAVVLFTLPACSPQRSDDELFAPGGEDTPVVNSMLVVGKPFPHVYISRTLRPDVAFSWERAGIDSARVTIEGGGWSVSYIRSGRFPGDYYTTLFPSLVVMPGTTYRLTAILPDGRVVRATTTTPQRIDVREWVLLNDEGTQVVRRLSTFADHGDSLYEQPENQLAYASGLLEARLSPGVAAGYQIGLQSLDLDSELLIDADFLDEEDLESFTRANTSPPLDVADTSLRVPWFAIYYEGRYKIRVFAMDRNWFDLARTDPVLGGGGGGFGFGGATGDATEPPIFHVEGGIGLFGSMSSDSIGFYVHAPAN